METYFEFLPSELTEIILLRAFSESSIIDLRDSKLFDKIIYNVSFWKMIFNEYELPIFNVTAKSILDNEKNITTQLFNILYLEFTSLISAISEYNFFTKGNYVFLIPIDYLQDISIFYKFGEIDNELFELLQDNKTILYFMGNRKLSDIEFIINTKKMTFSFRSVERNYTYDFIPSDNKKFLKSILIYLSYNRYKIKIKKITN